LNDLSVYELHIRDFIMKFDANNGDFGRYQNIVVVFNATNARVTFQNPALVALNLRLRPVQQHSANPIVGQ
jgi:hypothetical protein